MALRSRRSRLHARGAGRARSTLCVLVANLRQYAGLDQLMIDLAVEHVEVVHHEAIEQLVDDQTRLHVEIEFAHGQAEGLAKRRRRNRVGVVFDAGTAADHRQALIDRIQLRRVTVFGLRHHAADGERFLEFLVVDERQAFTWLARRFRFHRLELAGGKIAEDLAEVFLAHALDELALLAHFAHAVEIPGLHGIVLGLLGQIEQCVVDVFEKVADQAVYALERRRAHKLEQLSDTVGCRSLIGLPLLQVDYIAGVAAIAHPRAPLRRRLAKSVSGWLFA